MAAVPEGCPCRPHGNRLASALPGRLVMTRVTDLSPLKDMPLKELWCDFKADRDAKVLRAIETLETINDKSAAEFWNEVDKE